MLCRRRFSSVISLRAQKKFLNKVDVSSPINMVLDAESQGRVVRKTDFSVFPSERLSDLIYRLNSEENNTDLVANLLHRAVDIFEQSDSAKREEMRKVFQSEIYSVQVRLFSAKSGYGIFEIYNRLRFGQVAAKVRPEKLEALKQLIMQPILRIVAYNRDVVIDPNQVMERTGVDGFRSIMDLFHLDLASLEGRNLARLLNSMKSDHKQGQFVHFELLHVWFQVWDESLGVKGYLCPGWNLEKLLIAIIKKQSKDMLVSLFVQSGERVRNVLVQTCRQRHSITGVPKYPWANEMIDSWILDTPPVELSGVNSASLLAPKANNDLENDSEPDTDARSLLSEKDIFLLNSDSQLTRVKEQLQTETLLGLSFPSENVLSVACVGSAFVIDLRSVNPALVKFLVKKILNDPAKTKVVYSLEAFLNHIQSTLGMTEGVHFENLVDLRKGRVRRSFSQSLNDEDQSACIPGLLVPCEKNHGTREKAEFFFNKTPLSRMVQQVLQVSHDRAIAFQSDVWLYRPLSRAAMLFAAKDAHVLVELENAFRAQRMMPVEILNYDPF